MASKYSGSSKEVEIDVNMLSEVFFELENCHFSESIFEPATSTYIQSTIRESGISKPARNLESEVFFRGEMVDLDLGIIHRENACRNYIKPKSKCYPASQFYQDGSEIAVNTYTLNMRYDHLEDMNKYTEYERCFQMQNRECTSSQKTLFTQQRLVKSLESSSLIMPNLSSKNSPSMKGSICWMATASDIEKYQSRTSEQIVCSQEGMNYTYQDIQIEPFIMIRQSPLRIHNLTPAKTVTKLENKIFANGLQIKRSDLCQENHAGDDYEDIGQDLIPDFNWACLESLSCKVINWIYIKSKGISVYFMEDASIILVTGIERCPKLKHLDDKWLARYQIDSEIFESTSRGTCIQGDLVYFLDENSQLRCLDQVELAFIESDETSCYKASVLGNQKFIDIQYIKCSLYALQADGMVHMFNFNNKRATVRKYEIDMSLQKEAYRIGSLQWYSAFSADRYSLLVAHYEPVKREVKFILKTGKLKRTLRESQYILTIVDQCFHIHTIMTIIHKSLVLYAAFTADGVLHLLTSKEARLCIASGSSRICEGMFMSSCLFSKSSILICSGTGQAMLRLDDILNRNVELHF